MKLHGFLAAMFREPSHAALRTAMSAVCLSAIVFAGCGGSGSSGFDGALRSEAGAIELATSEGICVDFKGTTYCGSGAMLTIGDRDAEVSFEDAPGPVPCTQQPDDESCTSTVGFEGDGFPDTAVFVAAWAESETGPWTLASIDPETPSSDGEKGDVVVELPGEGSEPDAVVVAVLVYLDGPPDDAIDVAPRLRDFDPDVVFVSADVAVAPSSPE